MPESKEPFIEKGLRPEIKLDRKLSEITVRDLVEAFAFVNPAFTKSFTKELIDTPPRVGGAKARINDIKDIVEKGLKEWGIAKEIRDFQGAKPFHEPEPDKKKYENEPGPGWLGSLPPAVGDLIEALSKEVLELRQELGTLKKT